MLNHIYHDEMTLILTFIFLFLVTSIFRDIEKANREVKMLAVSNCMGH